MRWKTERGSRRNPAGLFRRGTRDERGVAAVEFALVLPLLLILMFGIVEFGLAWYSKQVLTNASREGARAGIARSAISVETVVQNYCANRLIPSGSSPAVSEAGGGAFQNDYAVSVTYEHHFMFAGIIGLPATKTLTGRTVMKMEPLPPS